jgi:hypothetical protein
VHWQPEVKLRTPTELKSRQARLPQLGLTY